MLKKLLAIATMAFAAISYAAVDVNKATQADLDGVKGIGPGTATKIMEERKKGDFKDWADLEKRVKGIKDKRAMQLSESGLTVGGASYPAKAGMAPKPAPTASTPPASPQVAPTFGPKK